MFAGRFKESQGSMVYSVGMLFCTLQKHAYSNILNDEAVTHNLCFWAEIRKISDFFYLKIFIFSGKIFSIFELMYTPVNPSFTT